MPDGSSNNPYIRTYAKDVAALSGKPDLTTTPAPVTKPATPVPPTTADAEREATLARLRERARKNPVREGELLPPTLPTPQPKAAPVGNPEPPSIAYVAVVPPPPLPRAPEPPPTPVIPPPPPPAPVPPPPPPVPIPTPVPAEKSPSPIHTYTSDFADRIDTDRASAFSVLAAQADSGAKAPAAVTPTRPSRKGAVVTALSIILILLGGAGVFAAYRYVSSRPIVTTAPSVPSLVFADDRQALTGEGNDLLQALANAANTPLPDGQVRVVYLTQASSTATGSTDVPLPGGRLVGALQLAAPDILMRNIAPESTVGIVHAGSETRAFFILKVLSYERTFAGMLQWEGRMASDLAVLYPSYPPTEGPPVIATTTSVVNGKKVVATTTVAAPAQPATPPHFIDEVASNHDVRALKDGEGRTILLYGYKDKETLVIARNEAAFAELLNRLSATKQQ